MLRVLMRMQPLSIIKPEKSKKWNEKIARYAIMPIILTSSLFYYKMKEVPIILEDDFKAITHK